MAFCNASAIGSVQALADLIASHKTLTHVDLSGNKFSEGGGQLFAESVARNTAILVLDLRESGVTDASLQAIEKHLWRNIQTKEAY